MSYRMSMWVVFFQKQSLLYCVSFLFKYFLTINKGQVDRRVFNRYLRRRLFSAIKSLLLNYFRIIFKKEVQMLKWIIRGYENKNRKIQERKIQVRFLIFLSCSRYSSKKNFILFHKNNIPKTEQEQVKKKKQINSMTY